MSKDWMNANKAARLTAEISERIITESNGERISAAALACSIVGYICRRMDMTIPPHVVVNYINNYPPIATVREAASHDIN